MVADAKLCAPDVIEEMNIKVFNVMSRTNETHRILWLETCTCKRRLGASVSNDKQRWNVINADVNAKN